MLKNLFALLLLLPLTLSAPNVAVTDALQSGQLLRMHVIAADDTPAMQALKAPVRDAVRDAYAAYAPHSGSMLADTQALLPQLTEAAQTAAQAAGYAGNVAVMLGTATFGERMLEGRVVPAGNYPALIIRIGAGLGHNWWGLVDPELSLEAAMLQTLPEGDTHLDWDWSLPGLWEALRHALPAWLGGVED